MHRRERRFPSSVNMALPPSRASFPIPLVPFPVIRDIETVFSHPPTPFSFFPHEEKKKEHALAATLTSKTLQQPAELVRLCTSRHVHAHAGLVALLWVGLVQTAARDVLEHYHYSVDMILAVVCTWAAWTWLEWVYPPRESVLPSRPRGQPPDPLPPAVVGLVFVGVGFGLFVLFVLGA